METHAQGGLPLWPLPALAAALPFLATWIAFALSVQGGWIEACNPFWDGCTSISRAARHGSGNAVFRALVLPAATLQVLAWRFMAQWLRGEGRPCGAALAWTGLVAGVFLILYATFLGTDGDIYRLLRRYGIHVYFGATFLAALLVLRALARERPDPAFRPLAVITAAMVLFGLANLAIGELATSGTVKDRWQNVTEWHVGLWLTGMFVLFAWRWRGLRIRLHQEPATPARINAAGRPPGRKP